MKELNEFVAHIEEGLDSKLYFAHKWVDMQDLSIGKLNKLEGRLFLPDREMYGLTTSYGIDGEENAVEFLPFSDNLDGGKYLITHLDLTPLNSKILKKFGRLNAFLYSPIEYGKVIEDFDNDLFYLEKKPTMALEVPQSIVEFADFSDGLNIKIKPVGWLKLHKEMLQNSNRITVDIYTSKDEHLIEKFRYKKLGDISNVAELQNLPSEFYTQIQ